MTLGFTGTQRGMSSRQVKALRQILWCATEVHLGDCIGADAQAHEEAGHLGVRRVGHPPSIAAKRAFLHYEEERAPKPYLDRNLAIVKAGVDGLIATPKDYVEVLRSGTWATIRAARRLNRPIWIILPNGDVKKEGHNDRPAF